MNRARGGRGAKRELLDAMISRTSLQLPGFLNSNSTRQYSFSRGSALGWGMPAAVGYSLGNDRAPVELAAQPAAAGGSVAVQALLAHGRLLHDLLPKTDGLLRELLAAPTKPELKALRKMILARQETSRATAREFRLFLYLVSLLLLGFLSNSV